MTAKRFIYDGLHIRDLHDKIPPILTSNDKIRDKFLNELNELHEENIVLKQEVELLRSGLEAYEDNLPVYLTCKEVNDFHSSIYDFKKKQQSFYNEHPNRCKIFVNGVELK